MFQENDLHFGSFPATAIMNFCSPEINLELFIFIFEQVRCSTTRASIQVYTFPQGITVMNAFVAINLLERIVKVSSLI